MAEKHLLSILVAMMNLKNSLAACNDEETSSNTGTKIELNCFLA